GRHRRVRCKHQERDRGRGVERHAARKCWSSRQPFSNSVAGGGHQLRRHPSVDDLEPFERESSCLALDRFDRGPAIGHRDAQQRSQGSGSCPPGRPTAQHRAGSVRAALTLARSPDPSRLESMPALIFDLDGTLVDTVYAHVFAWQRALAEAGLPIDGWRIHRRIGMSGGLFTRAVARELARPLTATEVEAIQARHGQLFRELLPERRPLPGAVALLRELREREVVHGIATSGRRPEIDASLDALGVGAEVVVVQRGDVVRAKPQPDLFIECARRLGVSADDCYVVGDAVWDLLAARRAKMLSVGVLSGGYGEDELTRAGAFRVYRDAAELHESLDELGVVP